MDKIENILHRGHVGSFTRASKPGDVVRIRIIHLMHL